MAGRRKRGQGEGTIYRRADGRWCAQATIGGKRRTVYGQTGREVRAKLSALLTDSDKGIMPSEEVINLAQLVERWLETVVKLGPRPRTYRSYSDHMRLYILPSLGRTKLSRLTPPQLSALYSQLLTTGRLIDGVPSGRPLAPKTVRNTHLCLHAALEQAVRWNLVPRNVADAVPPPRAPRKDVAVLTPEEVRLLLESCRGTRWGTLVDVAVNTGMRQSELLGLRWSDVDLDQGVIRVQRQYGRERTFAETKSRAGRRSIDLPTATTAALRAHRVAQAEERLQLGPEWEDHDLVFCTWHGRPLGHRNVGRAFDSIVERAGLPHVSFHALRHTHATVLLASGVPLVDVSARLGHSSPSITMDLYGHVLPDAGRRIAARLETLFS